MLQRKSPASEWTSVNPILGAGEIGFETDTNQFKIGDGTNHWSALAYFQNSEAIGGSLADYIPLTQKDAANGVATLDADGQVPLGQLSVATGYTDDAIANLVGTAPSALNTIFELATALDNSPDTVDNLITAVSGKQDAITAGTALSFSGDTLNVDYNAGLTVDGYGKLAVDPGFGISVDGGGINVNLSALAGSGLNAGSLGLSVNTDTIASKSYVDGLTTEDIAEGLTKLYFTAARAVAAITAISESNSSNITLDGGAA
jgi:hypothetical protein